MGRLPVDLFVVGTGMVGYRQFTRECEQAFDRAGEIYILHPLPEVREHVRDRWGSVVDLTDEYEQGAVRGRRYENMADRVLDAAADAADPVVLAVYGHPMVGVTPTQEIVERSDERDLTIEVLPGVSSIDCMYADLGLDPFTRGLQMFEATDLLVYEPGVNPEVPALVFQIGLVESRLYDQRTSAPERFTRIREYLAEFYPTDHEVCLVRTATLPLAESERRWFELDEFEAQAAAIDFTHTLYVPPAVDPPVRNETVHEQAYSADHLDRITE